jgi:hypothetical protein
MSFRWITAGTPRETEACSSERVASARRRTCLGILGSELAPGEKSFAANGSSVDGLAIVHRRAPHSGRADGAIRTHNTLSAEDTRVQVFYPFHPLRDAVLQVVRRPKRGDGAVVVVDPAGKRLKIPIWMLSPECAAITITERPQLSSASLLSLVSLLSTRLHPAEQIRDNLLETVVDGRKGGPRSATTTSGPGDQKGKRGRAPGPKGTNRTDRSHGPHSGDSL